RTSWWRAGAGRRSATGRTGPGALMRRLLPAGGLGVKESVTAHPPSSTTPPSASSSRRDRPALSPLRVPRVASIRPVPVLTRTPQWLAHHIETSPDTNRLFWTRAGSLHFPNDGGAGRPGRDGRQRGTRTAHPRQVRILR